MVRYTHVNQTCVTTCHTTFLIQFCSQRRLWSFPSCCDSIMHVRIISVLFVTPCCPFPYTSPHATHSHPKRLHPDAPQTYRKIEVDNECLPARAEGSQTPNHVPPGIIIITITIIQAEGMGERVCFPLPCVRASVRRPVYS